MTTKNTCGLVFVGLSLNNNNNKSGKAVKREVSNIYRYIFVSGCFFFFNFFFTWLIDKGFKVLGSCSISLAKKLK